MHAVITKFVLHSSATIANLKAVEKLQFKEIEMIASKAKILKSKIVLRPLIEGNISKYVIGSKSCNVFQKKKFSQDMCT